MAQPADGRKRVKVYELKSNDWFDRGTGFCTGLYENVSFQRLLPSSRERAAQIHTHARARSVSHIPHNALHPFHRTLRCLYTVTMARAAKNIFPRAVGARRGLR